MPSADDPDRLRAYHSALPISLLRARESSMRHFRRHVERYDLTLEQWRVLRALADAPGLDTAAISDRCVILKPSLNRIFKALGARGLIEQTDGPGRQHHYRLSPAGQALYDEASVESERIYRRIEAAFGTYNMAELLRLLDLLRERTDRLP